MAAQQPARTSPELRARLHSARANVGITPRPGALPKAVLIDSPPQPVFVASDRNHNLVEVPFSVKMACRAAADAGCILTTEFLDPHPDCLV